MKFFRYRRVSLKTALGITKAKKKIKKDLGMTPLLKPVRNDKGKRFASPSFSHNRLRMHPAIAWRIGHLVYGRP
jgi:hypothetical protein